MWGFKPGLAGPEPRLLLCPHRENEKEQVRPERRWARRCAQDEGQGSGKLGRAAAERRMGGEAGTEADLVTGATLLFESTCTRPVRVYFLT